MITYEKAHELFKINENWELVWKVSTGRRVKVGDIAGAVSKTTGYRPIRIDGKDYLAHRLIWLMIHGKFPADCLDHINSNRLDNRISNLREATHKQNLQNQTKPKLNNKSGFLGVSLNNGRFRAQIKINGKNKNLGYFNTAEQAHDAYLTAKRQHHEFCTI